MGAQTPRSPSADPECCSPPTRSPLKDTVRGGRAFSTLLAKAQKRRAESCHPDLQLAFATGVPRDLGLRSPPPPGLGFPISQTRTVRHDYDWFHDAGETGECRDSETQTRPQRPLRRGL